MLASDYHWRELLKLCVRKGAYRGVPLPDLGESAFEGGTEADAALADLVDNLEELLLDDGPDGQSEHMMQEGMEMPSHE